MVVADLFVVELKAIQRLEAVHWRQVVSYLKATRLRPGLRINFNVEVLRAGIQRVVLSPAAVDAPDPK
jgi:GxxExxY protein